MKREIKFRAWLPIDNKMILIGDCHNETGLWIEEGGFFDVVDHFTGRTESLGTPAEGVELMQYTGLKDKNGKEIYEGDILRYVYSDLLFNWLISFYDGAFIFQSIGIDGYLMDKYRLTQSNCLDREVIGNIYENPELLW